MRKPLIAIPFVAALVVAGSVLTLPASAQVAGGQPGAQDVSRIMAGTYAIDPWHSQVVWTVNHLGFNLLNGMFGEPSGTLTLDPAHPEAASVMLDIPIAKVVTTRAALTEHMLSAAILDGKTFPTATFKSTGIAVNSMKAMISGNLTLHGVTKPVVLDAEFIGAGINPNDKKATVGFVATTSINRSDFGIGYALPIVSDKVTLHITAAFERNA